MSSFEMDKATVEELRALETLEKMTILKINLFIPIGAPII